MHRIRPIVAASIGVLSLALAAGCGGDDGNGEDPSELLGSALENANGVRSGVANVDLSLGSEGAEAGNLDITASGPFQEQEGEPFPEFDLETEITGSGEGFGDFSTSAGLISNGEAGFVEYQDTAYEVPNSIFGALQAFVSGFSALLTLQGEGGPQECTEALSAQGIDTASFLSELENEGEEEVEGVETTQVSGRLDFGVVADNVGAMLSTEECLRGLGEGPRPSADQIQQLQDQLVGSAGSIDDFTLDFYVGNDDKLIHGFDLGFNTSEDEESAALDVELRIGSVNEPQSIQSPSQSEPLTSLLDQFGLGDALGQLGAGGGGSASSLPQAGGSPAPVPEDATQAYEQCLAQAEGAAATQQCGSLLE